jgi:hypothetical protein
MGFHPGSGSGYQHQKVSICAPLSRRLSSRMLDRRCRARKRDLDIARRDRIFVCIAFHADCRCCGSSRCLAIARFTLYLPLYLRLYLPRLLSCRCYTWRSCSALAGSGENLKGRKAAMKRKR